MSNSHLWFWCWHGVKYLRAMRTHLMLASGYVEYNANSALRRRRSGEKLRLVLSPRSSGGTKSSLIHSFGGFISRQREWDRLRAIRSVRSVLSSITCFFLMGDELWMAARRITKSHSHTHTRTLLARPGSWNEREREREKSITQFNLSIFYKSLGGARGTHNIIWR